MPLAYHHEVVAPGLHRFLFPSESRPGVQHELLLDLDEEGPGRLSCLCEASLYGKMCKHKRLVILGWGRAVPPGQRARRVVGVAKQANPRWQRGRLPRPKARRRRE